LVASGSQMLFNIQAQQETVTSRQQLIAQQAANTVASFVQEKFSELETATRIGQPTSASQEQQSNVLGSLLSLEPAFRRLVLLDSHSQELAEVPRLSREVYGNLVDRAESDLFEQVRKGNRYIGSVYVDEVTSGPMMIIAIPATDASGEFQGTLLAEVELRFMWGLVESLAIGQQGVAYVVDKQGNLIAFGNTQRVLRGENVGQLREVGEFVSSTALFDETGASISRGINGTTVVGTYVPLGTPDWAVVTELPLTEAYGPVIRSTAISAFVLLAVVALAGLGGVYAARRLAVPLLTLTETATRIAGGEMNLQAGMSGPAEVISLARAFNDMTARLRELIGSLEQRVAERTADLERRTRYLVASGEIGRAASSILEVDQLIRQVVELIRERFDLYYVGLFLVDERREWAVLRAGTGEAGALMLSRGHRLPLNEGSMVGWGIVNARARIAQVAAEDTVRLATPELPETRSEAALPLRSRGQAIGALTVQSARPGVFDETTVTVLQTMADQVAVALDNARLFTESQTALESVRRAYGEISGQAWSELLRVQAGLGFRSSESGVTQTEPDLTPEEEQALRTGQAVQPSADGGGQRPVAVPVKVRGQVVAVLDTYKPGEAGDWQPEEVALLEAFAEQLGQALESARLYQDSQRRAGREQVIGEVTARMRETLDMDMVLQTAILEFGKALDLAKVEVRLGSRTPEDIGQSSTLDRKIEVIE
jgi:GAF domain-containing protein